MTAYTLLTDEECEARIVAARRALADRLVILGHHHQRDEVFRHADFSGDSLKLSREAACSKAEYIVFCGVHFMAEVADILSRPDQLSILPDMAAGCSMADMANLASIWVAIALTKWVFHSMTWWCGIMTFQAPDRTRPRFCGSTDVPACQC